MGSKLNNHLDVVWTSWRQSGEVALAMLLPEDISVLQPPPEIVLAQRWLWYVLIGLYVVLIALDLVISDFASALLVGLLLAFCWHMLQNGMHEMPKYALIYGVLCGLNLLFELMPLVSELQGRVSRSYELEEAPSWAHGVKKMVWRTTTMITPFFDPAMGFDYNAESAARLVTVTAMGLATWLAGSAHSAIEEQTFQLETTMRDYVGEGDLMRQEQGLRQAVRTAAAQAESRPTVEDSMEASERQCERDFHHFHGKSYKLES